MSCWGPITKTIFAPMLLLNGSAGLHTVASSTPFWCKVLITTPVSLNTCAMTE